jgi:hypothetical protein
MDPAVIRILIASVILTCLLLVGWWAIGDLGRSSDVMASLFVPPDLRLGWPHGVQESDEPWGWRDTTADLTTPTVPVRPAPVGPARVSRR